MHNSVPSERTELKSENWSLWKLMEMICVIQQLHTSSSVRSEREGMCSERPGREDTWLSVHTSGEKRGTKRIWTHNVAQCDAFRTL